ncbi:MAG: RNA polymerase sigma factor [Bryobacteraceae bacterium]
MAPLSDEELVEKFRGEADPAAAERWINELFERYHARIATWCFRFTGSRESALDLAQETFFKAYRYLGSFRGDSKFSTWLYSIARNHCLNDLKARASEPMGVADAITLELPDSRSGGQQAWLERKEMLQLMRRLISESLDDTESRVMTLHYAEEMPLDAITRVLGLENASGAKAYVVSARRKLDSAIQKWKARQVKRR